MNLVGVFKVYLIVYPYSVDGLGEWEESLVNFLDEGLDIIMLLITIVKIGKEASFAGGNTI